MVLGGRVCPGSLYGLMAAMQKALEKYRDTSSVLNFAVYYAGKNYCEEHDFYPEYELFDLYRTDERYYILCDIVDKLLV